MVEMNQKLFVFITYRHRERFDTVHSGILNIASVRGQDAVWTHHHHSCKNVRVMLNNSQGYKHESILCCSLEIRSRSVGVHFSKHPPTQRCIPIYWRFPHLGIGLP